MNKLVSIVMLLVMIFGMGCAALSEYATPAEVDKPSVAYAAKAGVIDPNDYGGYGNLRKAALLEKAVTAAYEVNCLELEQLAERNQLDYDLLSARASRNTKIAQVREKAIFDPVTGLLAVGLGIAGIASGGVVGRSIGLARKRPQDWEPEEVDAALADLGVETERKTGQIMELINGAQIFIDAHKDDEFAVELKAAMDKAQSADTKVAVKIAKG